MAYDYKKRDSRNTFYVAWRNMHRRCTYPKTTRYEKWGGRGIKVCERWVDFDNFYADMFDGYKKGLSLDRIDNDGDYEPTNCRWATPKEQASNRSSSRLLEYNGIIKRMTEWMELSGYKPSTFRQRFYVYKWDIERCMSTPVRERVDSWAYEITLTDDSSSWTSPAPRPPLVVDTIEAAIDVTTLDLNVYTDLIGTKKMWTVNWGTMSAADFASLKGFYDRQFTLYKYPRLTISSLGVSNVVVRMTITSQDVVGDTGLVDGVTVTLRETIQTSAYYMVS